VIRMRAAVARNNSQSREIPSSRHIEWEW